MTKKTRAKVRRALLSISLVLVMMMMAVGGTIAWLTDNTDPIQNTFTVGNIDIDLTETPNTDTNNDKTNDAWTAELIPGKEYAKNPKVIVKAGSEKCYLFVKATVANNTFDTDKKYLQYTLFSTDTSWKLVPGETEVWYKEVDVSEATTDFTCDLLVDNKVTVNANLTNQFMPTDNTAAPSMTFQAYAVQVEGRTVAEAWVNAKDAANIEFKTGVGTDGFGVTNVTSGN